MFKDILKSLDSYPQDGLSDRIEKEAVSKKYWFFLGGSIFFIVATIVLNIYVMSKEITPPVSFAIPIKKDGSLNLEKAYQLRPLPFPHQSFKNVSSWIKDAISTTLSFNFLNFDNQVLLSEKFFTSDGYNAYLMALQKSKMKENIISKKLEVTVIPLQEPVLINGGKSGDTEFWRFRTPVAISYYAGKEPTVEKQVVEMLVLRVPSAENHRGLAIKEFIMSKM